MGSFYYPSDFRSANGSDPYAQPGGGGGNGTDCGGTGGVNAYTNHSQSGYNSRGNYSPHHHGLNLDFINGYYPTSGNNLLNEDVSCGGGHRANQQGSPVGAGGNGAMGGGMNPQGTYNPTTNGAKCSPSSNPSQHPSGLPPRLEPLGPGGHSGGVMNSQDPSSQHHLYSPHQNQHGMPPQNPLAAPGLNSPLYPWMRSQFGESD